MSFRSWLTRVPSVIYLGPQYARFPPKFYLWTFVPCDILSLVLQGVGGALSSVSSGGSRAAINVAVTGLSFQVFTLCVFIALAAEYGFRVQRARRRETQTEKIPLRRSFKIFVGFLSASTLLILVRCAYRIAELSDGYRGPLIHDQGLFIALEGV